MQVHGVLRKHALIGAVGLTWALLAFMSACGSSDSESSMGAGGTDPGGPAGGAGGAGGTSFDAGTSTGGSAGSATPPPPEREVESSFRSPIATGRFVWTTNPTSGRVARIDSVSLEVKTAEAGDGPTYLVAVPRPAAPETSTALVINVRSNDATRLDSDASGAIRAETLPLHAGANAWAVSKSGRWALAWTDSSDFAGADPTDAYQDVSVLDLSTDPPGSTRLSVGYRPSRAFIADDEQHAYFVVESGITVIDLGQLGPIVLADVPLTDDPLDEPASRDVSVLPSGDLAVVRREGSPELGLVSLLDGSRRSITLADAISDVDVSADGKTAIAVSRLAGEVALVPLPEAFDDASRVTRATIGDETIASVSIAGEGARAVLYTNGTASDRVTLLDVATGASDFDYRTLALKAPVLGVFPSRDALHAIALLQPSTKPGAFAVVPLDRALPARIQSSQAPLTAVAIEDAPSRRALVTERDDTRRVFGAYLVRMPELSVDRVPLASPPLASGIVGQTHVGFVAEEHPDGRITFIDLESGVARTLTGFELASKVIDDR